MKNSTTEAESADITKARTPKKISSFSVILIMSTLMIVGIAMIPLLNIQYAPQKKQTTLRISYSWNNASARIIESEVTSKLEGVLATMRGVENMESESRKSYGSIFLTLKKNIDPDAARFEASTLIKQIYSKLPDQVSYPTFSTGVSGTVKNPVITYTINSPLSSSQIEQFAVENIVPLITKIDGVSEAEVTGATPYEWVIIFNSELCSKLGIRPSEISTAVNSHFREEMAGLVSEQDRNGDLNQLRVLISNKTENYSKENFDWESIIIKNSGDRIITLKDIATVQYKEAAPKSYFRINGRNNVNLSVYTEEKVNTLKVTDAVKDKITEINSSIGDDLSFIIGNDTSERIREDLNKIYFRTVMSVLILLGFVYLVSRKWRYLLIITITLTANVLIAFIFYNLLDIELHIYSLAGITVSLGLIIDTSIIMIDHYNYYHNRKAFLAIFAALLTTIASLSIIFFLPEETKADLADFAAVIIINLSVSLVIALSFIPALLEKMPIGKRENKKLIKQRRRIIRFTRHYRNFIVWNKRHKWVLITVFILGFGIPVQLLPEKIKDKETNKDAVGFFPELYNKTLGSTIYREKIKPVAEPVLGGSMRLFAKKYNSSSFRMPERTSLYIRASMPEGCTIGQLNDLMLKMENYLSQYKEIDIYQTRINSYREGNINVTFKKEFEMGGFPLSLEQAVTSEAINLGGADWIIRGQGQGFSNAIYSGYKNSQINLTGYNYEQLYKYAEVLVDTLSNNRRVSAPGIYARSTNTGKPMIEYYLNLDFEKFTLSEITPYGYHSFLSDKLFERQLSPIFNGREMQQVRLASDQSSSFDVWHLENDIAQFDNHYMRLSELGSIAKRPMGNDIFKVDQQYQLLVAYDFIGAYELNARVMDRVTENLNNTLPLGYKAKNNNPSWNWQQQKTQYALLLLIIIIIYFICAILFESLTEPLVIIIMIPISFIGVFLTFALFDFTFDQGGFASFVLLSGIVVNAGIYIINEYNLICRSNKRRSLNNYLKAYNHKIIPITLTVISTVLGLVPFIYGGNNEVFWFSFAVGAIGGMIFSIIALIIYLPVLITVKDKRS